MTATAINPKSQPEKAEKPAEKLTAKNSNLYLATKAPKGGDFDDEGARSVRIRAKSWEGALIVCKKRKLRLDGLHLSTHKPEHVGWHCREGKPRVSVSLAKQYLFKLYFYNQLIDSSKTKDGKRKFEEIAAFLNERKKHPIQLCAGDYNSIEDAQKKFNKQ